MTQQVSITAGLVGNLQPSFGFVVKEHPKMGKLDMEAVERVGLPVSLRAAIKAGHTVTLDDGRVITPADVLLPTIPGRKVCFVNSGLNADSLKDEAL
jgi:ribonuclease Z